MIHWGLDNMAQTIEQFGQTIKAKYPQYNDISDTELGQKMLVKYPQYQDMVIQEQHGAPKIQQLQKELAQAQQESSRSLLRRFASELPKQTAETLLKTPARFVVSGALSPVDVTRGLLGKEPIKTELPLLGKTFQAEASQKQKEIIEGQRPLYHALEPFVKVPLAALETYQLGQLGLQATKIAGRATQAIGKGLFGSGFNTTAKEAPLIQAYKAKIPFWDRMILALKGTPSAQKPITRAETAIEQPGLIGTQTGIGIRAKRATQNIWNNIINPALEGTKNKVNMQSFFSELEKQIITETPELARRKDLLTALKALQKDYTRVGNVSFPKLQSYKEGWAKFVPEKAYQGKPITGVFNEIKNKAADLARNKIYTELDDTVKRAYLDYGNLKGIMGIGQKSMQEAGFKGGFGSFVSSLYDIAATPVKTIGGKAIYKTGKGIEFIGEVGAKNVGEILEKLL